MRINSNDISPQPSVQKVYLYMNVFNDKYLNAATFTVSINVYVFVLFRIYTLTLSD